MRHWHATRCSPMLCIGLGLLWQKEAQLRNHPPSTWEHLKKKDLAVHPESLAVPPHLRRFFFGTSYPKSCHFNAHLGYQYPSLQQDLGSKKHPQRYQLPESHVCSMATIVLVAVAAFVAIAALGAVLGAIAIVSFPLKAHGLRPMSQGGNYAKFNMARFHRMAELNRDFISCLIWVEIDLATLCVSLGATRSPRKPSCLRRSVAVVLIKLVTLSKSSKDSGFLRHIHPFFGHTPKYKLWSGGFGIAKVATASRGLLLEVAIMEDLTNHE